MTTTFCFQGGKVNLINSWQANVMSSLSGVWHDNIPFLFMFASLFTLLQISKKKRKKKERSLLVSACLCFCYLVFFYCTFPLTHTDTHLSDDIRLILTHWLWQLVRDRGVWRRHQEVPALSLVSCFVLSLVLTSPVVLVSCSEDSTVSNISQTYFMVFSRLCCSWTQTYALNIH